jgi:uncharacterized RDD family membrane protein YckC
MSELRHETVLGIDNIPIELPLARLGSRSLAAALDYLVVGAGVTVWTLLFAFGAGAMAGSGGGEPGTALIAGAVAVWILGAFAIEWGYFLIFEVVTGGSTLGKMTLGLRVVRRSGGRAATGALVVRNLVRTIDLVAGPIMMLLDPLSRRIGDWLGGTVVVHQRPPAAGVVLARVPEGWRPRQVAVAEELLARAAILEPVHAADLARRVLGWVARDAPDLLAGMPADADPLAALRRALLLPRPESSPA